jgi:GLPGLI family protein
MKKILFFNLFILLSVYANAQYTVQGKIEFERKTNVYRTISDMDKEQQEWIEKFKSSMPKFTVNYFDLHFTTKSSIYKPGREVDNNSKMWFARTPAAENVVYTDFEGKKVTAAKEVYDKKFLVQDSMRKIQWKITDEIRTIANYKCRKAVGKMFDSVYVVAFYTEDIMVSGGPEMFSGLPGMILEVAIPRLYTTWLATNIDIAAPKTSDITPPTKGKKSTQEEVYKGVKDTFEEWGKFASRYVWWTLL